MQLLAEFTVNIAVNSRLKSTLLVLFALTTVATGILAWQQNRSLRHAQVSSSDNDRAALKKRLAEAEHRAHALQNELDALKARTNSEDGTNDEPPTTASNDERRGRARGPGPGGGSEAMMALLNDPKIMQLVSSHEKLMLDSRYASLFKSLLQGGSGANLSPEQLDNFKNLLVEKQNTERDVRMSAHAEGVTDRSAISQLVKDAQSEVDAQIQSTLGPDGYAQYQQYEKTAPQRNLVNQVAQSLSYTNAPLTDSQNQKLVQILASNTSPDTNQRRGFGGTTANITDTAIAQANGVLSPAQLQALVAIQTQQKAQETMRDAVIAARNATATKTGTATPATPTPTQTKP